MGARFRILSAVDLRGDEAVLDIGCGDGAVSAFIAGLVPRGSVTGIDTSPDMIARATKRFPADILVAFLPAHGYRENHFRVMFRHRILQCRPSLDQGTIPFREFQRIHPPIIKRPLAGCVKLRGILSIDVCCFRFQG